MPSIRSVLLKRSNDGDIVKTNNQNALISLPPLMSVIAVGDATFDKLEVLPGVSGKSYIIHAYILGVNQTAGTACTGVNLEITDYWNGKLVWVDGMTIVANQALNETVRNNCLNVLTFPGMPVYVTPLGAAPAWKSLTLFYTEVDI